MKTALASAAMLSILACAASAQPRGSVGEYSDATIEGSVLEPRPIEVADDAEQAARLGVPEGFEVTVFARDLVNPRMLAFSPDGTLYATRRSVGDVVMLPDADGDGKAEAARRVASRAGLHGIVFDGGKVFLATVNDVYVADVAEDGSFGPLRRIIDDLPDGGQHPNRTLGIGPDGMLYVSAGSTCNACAETNPESATILRAKPDGSGRAIFASGLRNTIGFDWDSSGALWGLDHGIDWLGDDEQVEELNHIEQGKRYGWPYVYGMGAFNPQDNPPPGLTLEKWAGMSTAPRLGYTPHSAPMQMAFYDGSQFPAEYRGDAFVAMRGSWNRRPPSGYEVAHVDFEQGQPVAITPFLTGFLRHGEDGYGFLGRLAGLAVGPDGALYVGDDFNGVIYRVAYTGPAETASLAAPAPEPPAHRPSPPPSSGIAIERVEARSDAPLPLASAFGADQPIPPIYAAEGDNASPPLSWSAPAAAKSFVLIMDDPDARDPKPFTHWIAYDIPAATTGLREGMPTDPVLSEPAEMKQGTNSMGSTGYTGPNPPPDDPAHHYHLQIFALDVASLGIDPGARREEVLEAMQGKVIAKGEIVATFER